MIIQSFHATVGLAISRAWENMLGIAAGIAVMLGAERVDYLTTSERIQRHMANAHLLFNSLGVLLFIPFVPMTERLLKRLIPEKTESNF